MKGNKDYFAGYYAPPKKSKNKTDRTKKPAPEKVITTRPNARLLTPRFQTSHKTAEPPRDKSSRSKSQRSQYSGKRLIASMHKLRTTTDRYSERIYHPRKTSLDRIINGKNSSSPRSKQRSIPKEITSRGSLYTEVQYLRPKPLKVRVRKKQPAKSKYPRSLDQHDQLFKNRLIRCLKHSDRFLPPDYVRRSYRYSHNNNQEREIQTSFQTYRNVLGFHRLQEITIAPIGRNPLANYSPIEIAPTNQYLSPITDGRREDENFRLHRYSPVEKLITSPDNSDEIIRRYWMLNRHEPIKVADGFSTNLHSIIRYIGRVQIYLEPMKGQVCRRLSMKGRSPLYRIRDMQSESLYLPIPNPAGAVVPQYIFQEIYDLYSVNPHTNSNQYAHERCIFDCINSKFAEKLRICEPYSWQATNRKIKKYTQIRELFDEIEMKIVADASNLQGLHCPNSSRSNYIAESFEEEFQLKRDKLADLTIEIVVQLTDIIFEYLIEELETVHHRFKTNRRI